MALGNNLKKTKSAPPLVKDKTTIQKKKKIAPKKLIEPKHAPKATVKAKKKQSQKPKTTKAQTEGLISPDEVLRREALHQKFRTEITSLADTKAHLVVFNLSGNDFAVEINKVNEVVKTPQVTAVPRTPDYIPGIATIRNNSIILIDLAQKLGLEKPSAAYTYTMIVSSERFTVGILLPQVPGNIRVNGSDIEVASGTVTELPREETYIKGVVRYEGQMAFFIDIDELIEGDRMQSQVKTPTTR
ncbi:MAG: chemotaxis protein CheW [Cyclobacteriaceae bacterium]